MPKKKTTRRGVWRTEAEWSAILQRLHTSGLSLPAFCRREGVALSSLQRWRRRLDPAGRSEFVELEPASASMPSRWELEIALPNGVELRFRG